MNGNWSHSRPTRTYNSDEIAPTKTLTSCRHTHTQSVTYCYEGAEDMVTIKIQFLHSLVAREYKLVVIRRL